MMSRGLVILRLYVIQHLLEVSWTERQIDVFQLNSIRQIQTVWDQKLGEIVVIKWTIMNAISASVQSSLNINIEIIIR